MLFKQSGHRIETVHVQERVAQVVVEYDEFWDSHAADEAILTMTGFTITRKPSLFQMSPFQHPYFFIREDASFFRSQLVRARALGAQPADEALADDDLELGKQAHAGDIEVQEAVDRADAVTGMDSREHPKSGLAGSGSDLGIVAVTDFAVGDDIRVGAQGRPQSGHGIEVQVAVFCGTLFDLDVPLIDVLDRVLDLIDDEVVAEFLVQVAHVFLHGLD